MLRRNTYDMNARLKIGRAEGAFVVLLTAFNVVSVFYACRLRNLLYALTGLASLILVFAPYAVQKLLKVRISVDLRFTYILLAVCGPVMGNLYKCYYVVPYWDKMLHALSGYAFAALGYCLPDLMDKRHDGHSPLLKGFCALCFSVTVAAVWEFYEYAMDVFFGLDMQNDTIINDISSYALGAQVGELGSISEITSVSVNGLALPYAGYLDIGLIDTMNDMLVCTLGAVIYCVVAYACRNNPLFARITRR